VPIVRELITRLGYRIDSRDLLRYDQQVGNVIRTVGRLGVAAVAAGGALAVLGGARFVRGLIDTNVKLQSLQASLKTVTGSAEGAQNAFAFIQRFTATTPFEIDQVTAAFIKLKGAGIEPTEEILTSFGNTAAATQKDFLQFIEAVLDAAGGQFERLREFNIRTERQGENIAFTFRGATTVIKNNSADIVRFLQTIGDQQFAGAIGEQLLTLGGQISNVKDNVQLFLLAVGEAGFNQTFGRFLASLLNIQGEGDETARVLGQVLGGATNFLTDRMIDATNRMQDLLAVVRDVQNLLAGRDSVIGDLIGIENSEAVREFVDFIVGNLEGVRPALIETVAALLPQILLDFEALKPEIRETADALGELLAALLGVDEDTQDLPSLIRAATPELVKFIRGLAQWIRLWLQFLRIVFIFGTGFRRGLTEAARIVQTQFLNLQVQLEGLRAVIAFVTGDFEQATARWVNFLNGVQVVIDRLRKSLNVLAPGLESIAPGVTPTLRQLGLIESGPTPLGAPSVAGAASTVTSNASVGSIILNFANQPGGSPNEVAAAVSNSVGQALRDQLADANRNTEGALQ